MLPEEETTKPETDFEYREIVQSEESKDLIKEQVSKGEQIFEAMEKDLQKRLNDLK